MVSVAGVDCKDRWVRVRDNHRKALQRRRTKSGQAAKKIKPAKYEQELNFLVPYLSDGDIRQSNFSQSEDHKNTPSEIEEEQDENEEADELSPTTALPIPSTTISSGAVSYTHLDVYKRQHKVFVQSGFYSEYNGNKNIAVTSR